ncbi:MAG: hypothetical protein JSW67_13455 [Candidatus Latescibacterota bacterium]|nr:MAG: hypothetical protein JSW67_13455 [Candidatus Latescibacterota bacterium]
MKSRTIIRCAHVAALLLLASALTPVRADPGENGWLGVYFDAAGTQCSGTILPDQPGTVYVVAQANGVTATEGFAGAEFRFTGIPESWATYPVANPEILAIGNPFGDGVATAFPCPESDTYVLYSVLVIASAVEEDLQFELRNREPPTNPNFDCPLLMLCNNPIFTLICVETVPCFVNAATARKCEFPVAVSPSTWSGVKSLFR